MKWTDKVALARPEIDQFSKTGCKFAARCPFVMDVCHREVPKDLVPDGRMVKCHLYDPTIAEARERRKQAHIPLELVTQKTVPGAAHNL